MLEIKPGSIVSDGHVVLLPAGLTGTVTTVDGETYDLGPASQIALEVKSHDHAKEVAFEASKMALESDEVSNVTEFDEEASRRNLFDTQED